VSNEKKKWCFTWAPDRPASPGADKAALLKENQWAEGSIITIAFLDGNQAIQDKVRKFAKLWTTAANGPANLTFSFVPNSQEAMIRISFQHPGSWSVLGTSCEQITDKSRPTMNFGWFDSSTDDEEVRRTVLHEFGHAIGLIHEHQNPQGGIPWNRQAVTDDLQGPPNHWDLDTIEFNMFHKFKPNQVSATTVDPDSIMMYPIPPHWTENGFSAGLNTDLSAKDIELVKKAYP
jgi:serralysin